MADRIGIMKEGKLAAIVEMTLPRPKRTDDAAFTAEVRKVRAFLEAGCVEQNAPSRIDVSDPETYTALCRNFDSARGIDVTFS